MHGIFIKRENMVEKDKEARKDEREGRTNHQRKDENSSKIKNKISLEFHDNDRSIKL